MNTRIKTLRENILKISQAEFAKTLNLKRNSISLIEVGKRNPSDRTILDICEKFNVSESWLRNGTGEIFEKTPTSTMEQLKKEFQLDEFAYSFVYEYLKLDDEKRNAVQNFFHDVINRTNVCTNMKISEIETDEIEQVENTKMIEENEEELSVTVQEAEAEYIKSRLNSVQKTKSFVLNTTENRKNKDNKAANQ